MGYIVQYIVYILSPIHWRVARLERLYSKHHCYVYQDMDYDSFLKTSYWKEVAEIVKIRDKYRCTECGSGKYLQVHHTTYAFRGWDHRHLYTLVTLCDSCHKKEHNIMVVF